MTMEGAQISVLQKVMNRGVNDEFIARLFFGVLEIRSHIFSKESEREQFDKLSEPT